MAGLSDLFGGSPEQQGLMAALAQIAHASGPQRTPQGLYSILGGGLMAGQQVTQQAREQAQIGQLRDFAIRDKKSDYEAQELQRQRARELEALRSSYFKNGGPRATSAPAADRSANAMMQSLAGGGMPQMEAPGAPVPGAAPAGGEGFALDRRAMANQRMEFAQYLYQNGRPDAAQAEMDAALKLLPKVKEFQKVKRDGKVFNQAFYEDGTPGEVAGEELAQNLNWQDVGAETLGLDPTYGTVVARQRNSVSPNTAVTVAASRENAAATREVAGATRDAARMQRDQATELKMADDYRNQSKTFKETSDAYRQITATLGQATKSPAATLAAATKFMKLLDPGSVVRESELGMALAASGVIDRAFNYFNVLQSGRVLTPTQTADFQKITEQIYAAAQQGQQAIDANYRQQAHTYGLRPEMIVQDLGQNGPAGAKPKSGGQNYSDPEKERRYQEWKRSQGK